MFDSPTCRRRPFFPNVANKRWCQVEDLSRVLTWATRTQAPMIPAIASLVPKRFGACRGDPAAGAWEIEIDVMRQGSYHSCLLALCQKLADGALLGPSLRECLGKYIPERFLALVEQAEIADALPEVLAQMPDLA